MLQHGVEGTGSENKRPGDAYSESGLLDVREACAPFFLRRCKEIDAVWNRSCGFDLFPHVLCRPSWVSPELSLGCHLLCDCA